MNVNVIVSVGLIAALAAGGACAVAHWIAKRRCWGYVPRYVAGIGIGLTALVFPLGIALPINDALAIWGTTALIFAVEGLATWLAHDSDTDTQKVTNTPEADRILSKIDREI